MPDTGFELDPESLTEAAAKLSDLAPEMDEIVTYLNDADPEWWMWGTVGLSMSQQYSICADAVRDILGKLNPALEGIAERIRQCVESYEETDGSVSDELNRHEGELNGGSGDGSPEGTHV